MNGKRSLVTASLVYLVLGLVLLFFPGLTVGLLCGVVGGLLLLYGVITIISFFSHRGGNDGYSLMAELILGVLAVIVGIVFLTRSSFIISIIPAALGLYILIDGLVNLKRCLDMRSLGYPAWTTTLVMALISLVLSAIILLDPFHAALVLWRIIGGAFLYQAVSDLLAIHTLDKLVK